MAAGVAAFAAAQGALAANPSADQYSWSAELVAVDEATSSITIRSRVVTGGKLDALERGAKATLVWSGNNWAAGVRAVTRGDPGADARLTLPIEFVASEHDGQYVQVKVAVPRAELADVKDHAGRWITGISPRARNAAEAVADLRPYNDVT